MIIKKLVTRDYVEAPGLVPALKDTFVNQEGEVTGYGVVIPVGDDQELVVPWSAVKFLVRPRTPAKK